MIVGAPFTTGGEGKSYFFEFNSVTRQWNQIQKITSPFVDGINDQFGRNVRIDGDIAIVGADIADQCR